MENIWADYKSLQDDDQPVQSQNIAEPIPVLAGINGERCRENGADHSKHPTKPRHELTQGADKRPQRSKRYVKNFQSDQPKHANNQCIECGGSPPVQQSSPSRSPGASGAFSSWSDHRRSLVHRSPDTILKGASSSWYRLRENRRLEVAPPIRRPSSRPAAPQAGATLNA